MNIKSIIEGGKNILEIIFDDINNKHGKDTMFKLASKVYSQIQIFYQYQHIDGKSIKNLEDNIFEMKISIPQTKELLRIVFARERDKIILLSEYIIKPKKYDKKHNISHIKQEYEKAIKKSKRIYQDYKTNQKLNYCNIPLK